MSAVLASTRDASFLNSPRHDGVGGHRVGAWSPQYHVVREHPEKGDSWSACGTVFLCSDGIPAENVSVHMRCQRNGCRQAFAGLGSGGAS